MESVDVSSMKVCDITQCSICLKKYKEPKALPCIHTFCLQCLDKHCEDKEQEEVACPLCRRVFTIPPGGNKDLPNNFFVLQLLQVNESTDAAENEEDSKHHLCELCSDAEAEIPSTSYCIECDQHICERCSMTHKKSKVSRSHQVIRDADFDKSTEERIKLAVSYCDQHPAEQNRLYCSDCKTVTCHACLVDKHCEHKLTDVNKAAEKLRVQLKDDVDNVTACAVKNMEKIKQLEIETSLLMEKLATTEKEISQKCDQLIFLIQSHNIELMEELNVFKNKILKEVQTVKDEMERQFVIKESFKKYCQEMMNKGTACDISRTAHDLHARAEEFVKTQDEPESYKLRSGLEITFKSSLSTTDSTVKNFIGELVLRGGKNAQKLDLTKLLGSHTVRHIMPSSGQYVSGITVLDSEVFVIQHASQVHVYKSDDFTWIRNLTITGSNALRGLVSCSHFNCLYTSDPKQKVIYRYDLINNVVTKWSVSGQCLALSVTKFYKILATLNDTNRIQEYTTHGNLMREINLDSSCIQRPFHCIQLSTGNYVVCHQGTQQQHRVCIVDQSGNIIQSNGGSQGSGVGQLSCPYHLAVDMHDNVLVADFSNNRVKLLSPTLTNLGDMVISGHVMNGPYALHFDELNHRLYIGEWAVGGGRMFVIT